MHAVQLEKIDKRFDADSSVLRGLDLAVVEGELLALLGPSGCGKSTLLRLIAGLEAPNSGRILLRGQDATQSPPDGRDVAMVFQGAPLYPHLSVRANLAFALRCGAGRGRAGRAEIEQRVAEACSVLGIGALLDRRPHELSGGQRHRVALAKLFVRRAGVWLLDEPLSGLDQEARREVRSALVELHGHLRPTVVLVTHDMEDALHAGHRVAVMDGGRIVQVGTPSELLERPGTLGVVRASRQGVNLSLAGEVNSRGTWRCTAAEGLELQGFVGLKEQPATLVCPPGSLKLAEKGTSEADWPATVRSVQPLADRQRVMLTPASSPASQQRPKLVELDIDREAYPSLAVGEQVCVRVLSDRVFLFAVGGDERRLWPAALGSEGQKPSD